MTLVETDEPAHLTQDAQVVSWVGRIAFVRDGRVVDETPSSSGSGSLVDGGHR
jgi:hypothetical protein